jgi:hypothetical protein
VVIACFGRRAFARAHGRARPRAAVLLDPATGAYLAPGLVPCADPRDALRFPDARAAHEFLRRWACEPHAFMVLEATAAAA